MRQRGQRRRAAKKGSSSPFVTAVPSSSPSAFIEVAAKVDPHVLGQA